MLKKCPMLSTLHLFAIDFKFYRLVEKSQKIFIRDIIIFDLYKWYPHWAYLYTTLQSRSVWKKNKKQQNFLEKTKQFSLFQLVSYLIGTLTIILKTESAKHCTKHPCIFQRYPKPRLWRKSNIYFSYFLIFLKRIYQNSWISA